ncbi:MAG: hypothetical protein M1832_003778 [Thelocarpon impressellum]|nr:MAG: hypothetical protein M1832_003778 [Thelocarpon impressellum]
MASLAEPSMDVESTVDVTTAPESQDAQLMDLIARATKAYSDKDYSNASDLYAQASELQASINGETSTENTDVLFLYGRSLYQVGVSKSDVLGGKTAGEDEGEKRAPKKKGGQSSTSGQDRVAEEVVAKVVEDKDGMIKPKDDPAAKKPYFQITGDENWDDSEEEEDDGEDAEGGDADGEEEEDDLTAAWNVLDLARVLLDRKLVESQDAEGKGKTPADDSPQLKHVKERLADTHDLLAEISLEGEKFPSAVTDFKASLHLKQDLYPTESSLIAEAHYKLSLALEFASTTSTAAENGEDKTGKNAQVDEAGREEAAEEMEAAIRSCKLRVEKEEALLASSGADDTTKVTRAGIDDVKDMIADMEQRALDLRNPPVDIEAATHGPSDASNPLSSILGSLLGEAPSDQAARIEQATKEATDLSGLVRRKKPTSTAEAGPSKNGVNGNGAGKRKVEFAEEVEEVGTGKKARIEDAGEDEA